MRIKKYYYYFLHLMFMIGLLYAFGHFITTPKNPDFFERRLWAYESWIIFSFYSLFVFLTLLEKEFRIDKFKRILIVNLVLLVFPWGLFLLLAPASLLEILRLNSIYWRILGGMSLVGALIYYFPYRFYKHKLSYYILIFGAIDNLLAGLIITVLFIMRRIHLVAWTSAPLLFYFAYFFRDQSIKYRNLVLKSKKD
jgi:hypothetical protein